MNLSQLQVSFKKKNSVSHSDQLFVHSYAYYFELIFVSS